MKEKKKKKLRNKKKKVISCAIESQCFEKRILKSIFKRKLFT